MGCSYSAHTVLGLRIPYQTMKANYEHMNTRVVRGCEHEVPEGQKFCGICGAPREKTVTTKFYFGDWQEEIQERNPGLHVIEDCNESAQYIYIGFASESREGNPGCKFEMPSQEQVEALKKALRDGFIPLGLWDPRNFGVWTFLYVGC